MIVGLFLRHYKIYNGIHFIPVTINDGFSVYFGSNGIGKSSILEALDSFFNNRIWNINKFAKSHGFTDSNTPYIIPLFMVKKELLPENTKNDKRLKENVCKLSDCFWNIKKENLTGIMNHEEITSFLIFVIIY